MNHKESQIYDVIICGGGLAGILATVRIASEYPKLNLLLLEKNQKLGGRIRNTSREQSEWTTGLGYISEDIWTYWNQVLLSSQSFSVDLNSYAINELKRVGILQGNKMNEVPAQELFSEEGAQAIGGRAAVRDWHHITALLERKDADGSGNKQSLGQAFKATRRSPSAIILQHLSHLWGIVDPWSTQADAFLDISKKYKKRFFNAHWSQAMQNIVEQLPNLTIKTSCQVHLADKKLDQPWEVRTDQGHFSGGTLIIAISPWEASFLPKTHWPSHLAKIANRSKPASTVVLSDQILSEHELPEVIIIPAEDTQVIVYGNEICYQSTIDFEMTMQAPDVVKSIKRLKRARRKLMKQFPELQCEGDHIALIPVGWPQATTYSDRRNIEKLADFSFQSDHLLFCGDSYGPFIDTDQNFLGSVSSVFDQFAKSQPGGSHDSTNH